MVDFIDMTLPGGSEGEELERLSKDKFIPLIHKGLFKVQRERYVDKGVDLDVELKLQNGSYTNIVFDIQLKSTNSINKNTDGSFSKSIETSNIQYLFNNFKSLYVLYVKHEDMFYYEWVEEFYKFLDTKNPNWKNQGSNSLRFYKVLNVECLNSIYDEVLKTGKLKRELNEKIIEKSTHYFNIVINSDSHVVRSDKESVDFIEKHGFNFINAGNSIEIMKVANNASREIEKSPLVCLILSYASYYTGSFYSSLDYSIKANRLKEHLDEMYYPYLNYIESTVKMLKGLMTREEYLKNISVAGNDERTKFYVYLEEAKINFLSNPTEETTAAFQKIITEINLLNDSYSFLKLLSKCELLFINGYLLNDNYQQRIIQINILNTASGDNDADLIEWTIRGNKNDFLALSNQIILLEKEIEKHNHKFLSAFFNYCRAKVLYEYYSSEYLFNIVGVENNNREEITSKIIELYETTEISIKQFKELEHNYNICASIALKYELQIFLDDKTASDTFDELKRTIDLFEFDSFKKSFKHLQENGTYYLALKKLFDEKERRERIFGDLVKQIEKIVIQENELKNGINKMENTFAIDLFPLGKYEFPSERKKEFFDIVEIKDEVLLKQIDYMSDEIEVIPILNILYKEINKEGLREGYNANSGIEGIIKGFELRIKLFNAGFILSEL